MAAPMRIFRIAVYNKVDIFRTVFNSTSSAVFKKEYTVNNQSSGGKIFYIKSNFTTSAQLHSEVDIERLFIRDEVQEILRSITGFDLDKIFRVRPASGLSPPKYKLVTDAELHKMQHEAEVRARQYLQMPPVMNAWNPSSDKHILSKDDEIANFEEGDSKYVFTDISNDIPARRKAVVVREMDGTLRVAEPSERDRALHIYFPTQGKSHSVPQAFQQQQLEKLLGRERYEYILDWSCVQFEPDDPEYIRVTQRTYEHVASRNKFHDLRSTRHFGPMSFYLCCHKKIDTLVVDMIHRDLFKDAEQLVRLYHIIHSDCESAKQAATNNVQDPEQLIMTFAKLEAREGGMIELALQNYLDTHRNTQSKAAAS